ncbi:hypothetical protein LOZ53_003386 [Ophidiomyces ophidiicola]|nr:hypothetical protein LOZ55_004950 [Ophidiomyces ophidiicola]KAI1987305.1 hypothetical protein LOZ51_005772 [Ophidiomyces ophidiicola]KAI1990027.1 hypothetical protein LOZ53_003386 [Ophidiomyces ophidiicola]KAI1990231.1 hypothetical protein LOZ54_002556 [Ophidiomyces ophidiicola]
MVDLELVAVITGLIQPQMGPKNFSEKTVLLEAIIWKDLSSFEALKDAAEYFQKAHKSNSPIMPTSGPSAWGNTDGAKFNGVKRRTGKLEASGGEKPEHTEFR